MNKRIRKKKEKQKRILEDQKLAFSEVLKKAMTLFWSEYKTVDTPLLKLIKNGTIFCV